MTKWSNQGHWPSRRESQPRKWVDGNRSHRPSPNKPPDTTEDLLDSVRDILTGHYGLVGQDDTPEKRLARIANLLGVNHA